MYIYIHIHIQIHMRFHVHIHVYILLYIELDPKAVTRATASALHRCSRSWARTEQSGRSIPVGCGGLRLSFRVKGPWSGLIVLVTWKNGLERRDIRVDRGIIL